MTEMDVLKASISALYEQTKERDRVLGNRVIVLENERVGQVLRFNRIHKRLKDLEANQDTLHKSQSDLLSATIKTLDGIIELVDELDKIVKEST